MIETDRLPTAREICWPGSGAVVTFIDEQGLAEEAARIGCIVRVDATVGDFVPFGAPLLHVLGEPEREIDDDILRDAFALGTDRTPQQDVALGFRHLVDIALRALSPGINDPTTAVQAIDSIHDLLRRLVDHPLRASTVCDARGKVRVILRSVSWDALVGIALTEIRLGARGSVQVHRRLSFLLDDLIGLAAPDRRPVLELQRALLRRSVVETLDEQIDRTSACCADPQGLGSRVVTEVSLRH